MANLTLANGLNANDDIGTGTPPPIMNNSNSNTHRIVVPGLLATSVHYGSGSSSNSTSDDAALLNNGENRISDEFKSVQSLKQFWNQRIGESEHTANATTKILFQNSNKWNSTSSVIAGAIELRSENFDKYKTADTVKSRRNSLEVRPFWAANNFLFHLQFDTNKIMAGDYEDNRKDTCVPAKLAETVATITAATASTTTTTITAVTASTTAAEPAIATLDKTDKSHIVAPADGGQRRVATTARKCSFKTGAHSSGPAQRKFPTTGGSKVAALTYRFNQLVQQDAAILEKVKKRGVIVHRTAAHVYRIQEERTIGDASSPRASARRRQSTSQRIDVDDTGERRPVAIVRRMSSARSSTPAPNDVPADVNCIQTTIDLFEPTPKDSAKRKMRAKAPKRNKHILVRRSQPSVCKPLSVDDATTEDDSQRIVPSGEQTPNGLCAHIDADNGRGNGDGDDDRVDSSSEMRVDDAERLMEVTSGVKLGGGGGGGDKSKSKYEKMYEKIRFKSSFLPKKKLSIKPDELEIGAANVAEADIDCENSVVKIEEALESVNQRLADLSRNNVNSCDSDNRTVATHDTIYQNMKPNESFLFRSQSRHFYGIPIIDNRDLGERTQPELAAKSEPDDASQCDNCPTATTDLNSFDIGYEVICKNVPTEVIAKQDTNDDVTKRKNDGNETKVEQIQMEEATAIPSNIYQSVHTMRLPAGHKDVDTLSVNSYESFENYESVTEVAAIANENGYDLCDNRPEPPPPRKPSHGSGTATMPPLPMPKRNFNSYKIQKSVSEVSNYEKIKYGQTAAVANVTATTAPTIIAPELHDYEENIYDTIKNLDGSSLISNCYEIISEKQKSDTCTSIDSYSLQSNCYESINSASRLFSMHCARPHHQMIHGDSITTLSSDHKTNSLYGVTMHGASVTPPSETTSVSDNSDEWIDMSDDDDDHNHGGGVGGGGGDDDDNDDNDDDGNGVGENARKHNFVVTRQRTKCNRNLDWSKRVRCQRITQHSEFEDDDSDHHYETLYTTESGVKGTANNRSVPTASFGQKSFALANNSTYGDGGDGGIHDAYDSFESDHELEADVKKNTTDHFTDITNTRLPDPPSSTGQVYAIMQKIKNFGSLSEISKSISRIGKKKSPNSKTDKSGGGGGTVASTSTMSPVDSLTSDEYQNLPFDVKSKRPKGKKVRGSHKAATTMTLSTAGAGAGNTDLIDPYENTEFHSPRTPQLASSQLALPARLSSSSTSASSLPSQRNKNGDDSPQTDRNSKHNASDADALRRNKTKISKSFKSKLRRSLGPGPEPGPTLIDPFTGSTSRLEGETRSIFYVTDSVDVDSGIFSSNDKPHSVDDLFTHTIPATGGESPHPVTFIRRKTQAPSSPSSSDVSRRKTIIGLRPVNPPPPPPPAVPSEKAKGPKRLSSTSWYAECAEFKSNLLCDTKCGDDTHTMPKDEMRKGRSSNSSWYTDAGLYQTSVDSIASSSGSSGVSTGGEGGPGDDQSHSMFLNEPLYQIYTAAKLESIARDIEMATPRFDKSDHERRRSGRRYNDSDDNYNANDNDNDANDDDNANDYERINPSRPLSPAMNRQKSKRPTALQLVAPRRGFRTLWSQIPEVVNSEIFATISDTEKKFQEAKFEILTSEASYLKSLNLLRTHFMNNALFRDPTILSPANRKTLFSFIHPVAECSNRLLCDLESCWQNDIMLDGLALALYKHAEKYFKVYVSYCEHQGKLDRTLRQLKDVKGVFAQNLELLEADSACHGLTLHSFLMLPMQRITRLPLLIDAVLSRINSDSNELNAWKNTLAILNKIVAECNEAANRCEKAYEMEAISRSIEFPDHIGLLPIMPVGMSRPGSIVRTLVRRGELTHLIWRGDDGKLTFGKKFTKSTLYAFLFTDLFVLTKRKGEDHFTVVDYCQRSMLNVSSGENIQLPTKEFSVVGKNLILMTFLENCEGRTIEMILSCASDSERQRWLQAAEPPNSDNPDEKLYEQWDCPQVTAIHTYQALQPDELSLDIGDIVNVTRKMVDGWYHGERIRDGAQGWFPGNFTEEIASPHVRARNLKQRYRLLTFTANYLELQKRK